MASGVEAVRAYVIERYAELRDLSAWAKAWVADPLGFAVSFMAAAARHDGRLEEDGPGQPSGADRMD